MFQKRHKYLLDGRLNINRHKIAGLLDSIRERDAVTKQYVLDKVQKFRTP